MKKIIKKIVIIVTLATTLVGCTAMEGMKGKKQEKDSIVYYKTDDNEELYALTGKDKSQKIASNAVKFIYAEALNKYIVINKDKDLFTIDKNENRSEIDAFVNYIDTPKADSTIIYYINEDGELYEKDNEKDKSKIIARDVKEYRYINKNDIAYKKSDDYLYVKKEAKESFKLAEEVSKYEFSKDLKNIIYMAGDGLYLQSVNEDKKEALAKEGCTTFQGKFIGKNSLVYLINNEGSDNRGELYYKDKGHDPLKLASNVISMEVTKDEKGLYYLDDNNSLYFIGFNRKEPVEVLKDVVKASVYENKVVALNKDNKLFINNEALDEDIEKFNVNGNDIVYLKTNGEGFIKRDNKEPELIIEDYKKYKNLYFMNNNMYTNLLTLEELNGYWILADGKYTMLSFTENSYSETTDFFSLNAKAAMLKNKSNEITIYLENDKTYTRTYKRISKDLIDDGFRKFKRTDQKTYEAYQTKLKKIRDYAASYLGEPITCVTYYDKGDKRYYLYVNTNNSNRNVIIDEDAKGYKYDEFVRNNSLVPVN